MGLISRRASGRSAGLILLGGAGALALVALDAVPQGWLAALAPLTLLALSPAIWLMMRGEGAGPESGSAAARSVARGARLWLTAAPLAVSGPAGLVLLARLDRVGGLVAGNTLRSGLTFGIV